MKTLHAARRASSRLTYVLPAAQFLSGAIVALGVLLAPHIAGAQDPAKDKPTIRVSTQSKDTIETWQASGVLNDAPYRVEWSLLGTATEETASLLARTTDIALGEGSVSVTLQQGNAKSSWANGKAPVVIIAAHSPRNSVDYKSMVLIVKADGPIKTPADLKGKSITFKEGGNMNTQALLSVKKAGLKHTDVTLVNLSPADGLVAFRSGQVDALANSPAQVQSLVDTGKARVIYTNTDVQFPSSTATVVRTDDLRDPTKEAVFRDFVVRIQKWNDWKGANPDKFEKILTTATHLKPDVARYQARAGVSNVDIVDAAFLATEQRIADVLTEAGGIPKQVDVGLQYDTRFNDDIRAARSEKAAVR